MRLQEANRRDFSEYHNFAGCGDLESPQSCRTCLSPLSTLLWERDVL